MDRYTPAFDTTVRTTTVTERHNTRHTDSVDWEYPFDDPEHTDCMCCSDDAKREDIEKRKEWLRQIEATLANGGEVYASNYGGWPRIWHRVYACGMASCWPYWRPRPTVFVDGTLGLENYDWMSLTGVEVRAKAKEGE